MSSWKCTWCMKDRSKAPEYEQQRVTNDEWKPLCSYCYRKRLRHLTSNPFGGLVWQFIREITPTTGDRDGNSNARRSGNDK